MLMLLLKDEARHLLRTRIALYGLALPLLSGAAVFHPDPKFIAFAAIMGANMGGLITGGLVATSLVSDLQAGTPVLFAVRPIPRAHPILARFLAVVLLLIGMQGASLLVSGLLAKALGVPLPMDLMINAFMLGAALAFLSGAVGLLTGVLASSSLAAILAVLFLGSNLNNGFAFGQQSLTEAGWSGWGLQALTLGAALVIASVLVGLAVRRYRRMALR